MMVALIVSIIVGLPIPPPHITGYSRAELIGENPRILKSGELPLELYKELWETISKGKEWRGELHN